ncbi:AmmeMemoRadiSam system protein B [Desulfobaculum bizertense]|uniref:MEMO1 family protein SAMN02745702_01742 n=1 Tax=Desulfobaculum bizertense DSM 18034 TaxID=1121442 RepID=A0A1T4W6P2_9BACT|nr:AmmeMemoRadiSam system protein B [Desulfobaculum bizertense]UIJ39062.1 AmmeMemoRadiSam system protein B [Desulfobaculum bizertense]SKA72933.1 hypothetical protein SAMN02745702_01742 [Desulfobaculum bizertense DSM 18034]
MQRNPVVAGRFYPDSPEALNHDLSILMRGAGEKSSAPTLLAMVPHAGYMFSGQVCGQTLAQANLAKKLVLLGPNHTGRGARLAVWPDGSWQIPGADVPVESELAHKIIEQHPAIFADRSAHLMEHSLEVVLPFLAYQNCDLSIVPISVSEPDYGLLEQAGNALGDLFSSIPEAISIAVSSDMSHYISAEKARTLDGDALDAVMALNPRALYDVVRKKNISMCGMLPMTLGMIIAKKLGAHSARLVAYSNSGDVTGDFDQVVGYAGVLIS